MSVFQCHIPLLSPTPQPEQYAVEMAVMMAGKKRKEKGEEKRKVCTVLLEGACSVSTCAHNQDHVVPFVTRTP